MIVNKVYNLSTVKSIKSGGCVHPAPLACDTSYGVGHWYAKSFF